MATTYKSNVYLENANFRPDSQNQANELTATVLFPDGVQPVSGDVIKFCKIGENVEITYAELILDKFDSNASAALAAELGTTDSVACILATGTVLQTNTTGAKSVSALGGDKATGGGFAVNPFPVSTTVEDVLLTFTASAGTAFTTGNRKITLRIKYQYAYPDQYVTGVTGVSSTNLLGTKSTSQAVVYTYGGNAP